eukprot:GDKI01029017.1.p1 GENE.GDKI01029017.1~~GDKI01029017.1.p1  ORF type:complete len:154 (-),score=45.54 GDKI01029017.1:397-858(-)
MSLPVDMKERLLKRDRLVVLEAHLIDYVQEVLDHHGKTYHSQQKQLFRWVRLLQLPKDVFNEHVFMDENNRFDKADVKRAVSSHLVPHKASLLEDTHHATPRDEPSAPCCVRRKACTMWWCAALLTTSEKRVTCSMECLDSEEHSCQWMMSSN